MLPKSLQGLVRRVEPSLSGRLVVGLNCLIGLAIPVLGVLVGHVIQVLLGQPVGALSSRLPNVGGLLEGPSSLSTISHLLLATIVLLIVIEVCLYVAYRLAQFTAVDFEVKLIRQFRSHSLQLARSKTLSAQRTELIDCLDYHLPRVRSVFARFLQAVPRHAMQFTACVICAALIHVQFTLLAIIATALLVVTYQFFDRLRRTKLPVVRENASLQRNGLVGLVLRGPLLQSVRPAQMLDRMFDDQLQVYRRDAGRSLTSSAWKTPAVALFLGVWACLLTFVMAVQILQGNLQLPSAVAFLFCLTAAVFSARRLMQVYRDNRQIASAVDELNGYLSTAVPSIEGAQLLGPDSAPISATLEHATVQDSRGRKLLEDVTYEFRPGSLIGVVASQPLEARALVEMLLGLGQPSSGRMLLNGRLISDLQPDELSKRAQWVAADGALLTGTLFENLAQPGQSVEPAIQRCGLVELVQRLPDGVNTLITDDDDRLQPDDAFRTGLARSLLGAARILVIDEPDMPVAVAVESTTLQAIQSLADAQRVTVILPKRLSTLRSCATLIFLHEHRVADVGSHAELVQRNELYRHLSYMRFNQFARG